MKTIFWGNYKGGVGKTTSVFQIAAHFASGGKRILLIDLDPQCSLSHICCSKGVKPLAEFQVEETLNYLIELYMQFISSKPSFKLDLLMRCVNSLVQPIVEGLFVPLHDEAFEGNLFFIPSSLSFENARINKLADKMRDKSLYIFLMKLFIEDIGEHFDYIFFDCPPTTNALIESVFLTSDYYIVPTIIDEISAKGVPDYITQITKTYRKYCMDEQVGGVLMQQIFRQHPKLIGIFETIYKERPGKVSNEDQIVLLDKNISKLTGVSTVLCQDGYAMHRYNDESDGLQTQHVFKYYIQNKDNRSSGESIPKNTSRGCLTPAYGMIAMALLEMV